MTTRHFTIIHYVAKGLLTLLMLFSASMYFTKYEMVQGFFTQLGYPAYLVYPLAIAKILGLIAIWYRKNDTLREWAYAGFFFDTVLAATAHLMIKDGGHMMAVGGVALVLTAYFTDRKAFPTG